MLVIVSCSNPRKTSEYQSLATRIANDIRSYNVAGAETNIRKLISEGVVLDLSPEAREIFESCDIDHRSLVPELVKLDDDEGAAQTPPREEELSEKRYRSKTRSESVTPDSSQKQSRAQIAELTRSIRGTRPQPFTVVSDVRREYEEGKILDATAAEKRTILEILEKSFSSGFIVDSGERRSGPVDKTETVRLDLQGYFEKSDKRFVNFQVQKNIKRTGSKSTTFSAVMIEIPPKGEVYHYNGADIIPAFMDSQKSHNVIFLFNKTAERSSSSRTSGLSTFVGRTESAASAFDSVSLESKRRSGSRRSDTAMSAMSASVLAGVYGRSASAAPERVVRAKLREDREDVTRELIRGFDEVSLEESLSTKASFLSLESASGEELYDDDSASGVSFGSDDRELSIQDRYNLEDEWVLDDSDQNGAYNFYNNFGKSWRDMRSGADYLRAHEQYEAGLEEARSEGVAKRLDFSV
jgi:hypothetical protein